MILDIFALLVIAVLIAAAIVIIVALGNLPGRIARQRANPQADAITALSWIGIVTLGLAWPFALVWAYWKSADQQTRELSERMLKLESELQVRRAREEDA